VEYKLNLPQETRWISVRGRVLFDDGRMETAGFLDRVYSDYARLNEERAAILDDVRRRGSIHG
jgi:hypothetical protein